MHDNLEVSIFFQLANSTPESSGQNTRFATQALSLVKPRFRLDIRKNFFAGVVVDPFNVKLATTLNQFKHPCDK